MADSDIFVSNDIELDVDFGEIYVIDQGVVTKVVASKYDPTKTYVVGEYVIHLEKLYKCVTAIEEPEEFNSEKWTNVLLANEVQALNVVVPTKADKSDTYTKQEVNTALAGKADKADTYTKQEVDTAVGAKADKSDTYTKQDVNDALALKADKSDTYTKSDVNGYLDLKADKSDTYTKQEVDTAVGEKANSDDVYDKSETYSKTEVNTLISNLPAPMIMKGTLGTGGTITTLPTASSDNEGFTYKVITDGTYAEQAAKSGDLFTSAKPVGASEYTWLYIPSGDETFTDTWRGIKVNGTEKLGSAISSGEVDFINGTNTTVSFNSTGNKIKVDVDGYTQAQVDTKLSVKANSADVYTKSATDDKLALKANSADVYNKTTTDNKLALKADKSTTYTKTEVDNLVTLIGTAQGDIASFETNLAAPLQSVLVNVVATGGSGTPDNPNPIVGYSSANITRCGVNLFDKTNIFEGYINDTNGNYSANANYKCTDYIPLKGGLDYYIKSDQSGSNWGAWYDSEKNYIEGLNSFANRVKTAPANACFARLTIWASGSGDVDTFGFNYPATDTTYHAYNGQTYAIAFGQTVYGGVLDVTRGKLHVTFKQVDLGDLTYTATASQTSHYVTLSDAKYADAISALCTIYKNHGAISSWDDLAVNEFVIRNQTFRVHDDTGDTPADFKTRVTGQKLVYELATPFDIDLTPVQIRALVGENNVFADCGKTEVEYINSNAEDTVDIAKSVIEQTNLSDLADIPNPPTTDGNYRLKVTILSGKAIYSWEEIT